MFKNIEVLCREIIFWLFIRVYYLYFLVIFWFSGKKLLFRLVFGEGGDCGDFGDGIDRGEFGEWIVGDFVVFGRVFFLSSGLIGCGGLILLALIRGGRGLGLILFKGILVFGLVLFEYLYIVINFVRGMFCF